MLMVASRRTVTASVPAAFINVIVDVSRLMVVDDTLMDRGFLVPL
jgi:hypothetical protein